MNDSLIRELAKVLDSALNPGETATLTADALKRAGAPEGLDAIVNALRVKLPGWTIRTRGKDVVFVRHA